MRNTSGSSTRNTTARNLNPSMNAIIAACFWTIPNSAAFARAVAVARSEPRATNADRRFWNISCVEGA